MFLGVLNKSWSTNKFNRVRAVVVFGGLDRGVAGLHIGVDGSLYFPKLDRQKEEILMWNS